LASSCKIALSFLVIVTEKRVLSGLIANLSSW
jgi:hypothetical protein